MAVLEAKNLVKAFGPRTVVKGFGITVRSGEIVGLLGRNGAGKTTVFHMVVGLLRPDDGGVFLDGRDITRIPAHLRARAGLTYLPQENSIFLRTTVAGNLKLALDFQPLTRAGRKEAAEALLEEFGLLPLARQAAHSLSGGERRRLEICRALVLNPKFLLLDEPFTGIDPLTIAELQKIMSGLRAKGIGILLSDHNVRDTFRIADRACIIDNGEILIEDAPVKVAADAEARRRFLGTDFTYGEERREPI